MSIRQLTSIYITKYKDLVNNIFETPLKTYKPLILLYKPCFFLMIITLEWF